MPVRLSRLSLTTPNRTFMLTGFAKSVMVVKSDLVVRPWAQSACRHSGGGTQLAHQAAICPAGMGRAMP